MGAPQYEQAGADIGGTGTTNTIPRWTGPSTLGDSGLVDNGTAIYTTTRNVGIGTASPTDSGGWSAGRILDVRSGSVGTSAVIYVGDSGRATNTQLGFYGSGYGFVGTVTNHSFQILQNNGAALVVDTSKNVGIGTASPGTRLHVLASGTDVNAILANASATRSFTEYRYNTSTVLGFFGTASGLVSGGASADFAWRVEGSNNLIFATGTAERARIDSNGNIYGTSGTTGMTNGFFYIPAAAGAPTGVPTAVAGRVPMYYDTTNNQFYVYNGGWKKVTLA